MASSDKKIITDPREALEAMLDTSFDCLVEVHERDDCCKIFGSELDLNPLIDKETMRNLLERGFVERLEEATLTDGGSAYRCTITVAAYHFLFPNP